SGSGGGVFCCAVDVPVVTPGIATAIDGALNKLSNNSRIHGTVPSGENVEQNDKYRGQGAEGVFWEQSGVKKPGMPGFAFQRSGNQETCCRNSCKRWLGGFAISACGLPSSAIRPLS